MNLVVGKRRTGKTLYMIKECAKNGGVIICNNQLIADSLKETAKHLGIKIKDPVSYLRYITHRENYNGLPLFFDLDEFFGYQHTVSLTAESLVVLKRDEQDIFSEEEIEL